MANNTLASAVAKGGGQFGRIGCRHRRAFARRPLLFSSLEQVERDGRGSLRLAGRGGIEVIQDGDPAGPKGAAILRETTEKIQALRGIVVIFRIQQWVDRKSTRLNSSHLVISYAVFCL